MDKFIAIHAINVPALCALESHLIFGHILARLHFVEGLQAGMAGSACGGFYIGRNGEQMVVRSGEMGR